MSRKPQVLVLGGPDYQTLFESDGWDVTTKYKAAKNVDLVCFSGGTDINPSIYNQPRHHRTQYSDLTRDRQELAIFQKCVKHDVPMVGICRGAQLLCALSGGSLIQHATNHDTWHTCYLPIIGKDITVSSSHHQMMFPWDVDHIMIGYARGRSTCYQGADEKGTTDITHPSMFGDDEGIIEPEIVYFPETRALCHQPHPEWMQDESEYRQFFFETIDTFLEI